jgi:hypothetical protein
MLDLVREIVARIGRAVAVQILGSGSVLADTPWPGLYPRDADPGDELEAVHILPHTPEFEEAERAAKEACERTMVAEFD